MEIIICASVSAASFMRVLECLIYILKAHYYGLLMLAMLPSLYLFTQYV